MRINKTYVLTFVLLLASLHCIGQRTFYVINSVVPSPIIVGEREVKKGDTVSGNEIVKFSCTNQKIRVQAVRIDMDPIWFYSRLDGKTLDYGMLHKDKMTKSLEECKGLITKGIEKNTGYSFFNGIKDTIRFGSEKRLAIVIGNNSYIKLDSLTKPSIDADNMQNKLVHLGFDVMEVRDATKTEMKNSFNEFFTFAANKNYNMVLVYFSGHGVRYDGKDYMLPIDAKSNYKYAEKNYYSVNKLLDEFHNNVTKQSDGTNFIIIMDACRKPFGNKTIKEVESNPIIKENELLFYAVSVGEPALQGAADDTPSPFTKALIDGIGKGEKNIYDEFFDIKCAVENGYVEMNPNLLPGKGWFHNNSFIKKKSQPLILNKTKTDKH